MILFVKNLVTNEVEHFRLNSVEDFDAIFKEFPSTHEIALRSRDLEDAAQEIAKYLSRNSHMDSWVHDTRLHKGEEFDTGISDEKRTPKPLENKGSFLDRFDKWFKQRNEVKPLDRDNTFSLDPGRLREKKLDEVPDDTKLGKLRDEIDNVNEKNKKG